MRDVLESRQPADPFAGRTDIREQLQAALRSGLKASP
jgi:hypothetical protein